MTPPKVRPRDKRSSAAAEQLLQEAAKQLLQAEQDRLAGINGIAYRQADPHRGLAALEAYRRGQAAVDEALANLYAALRLGGASQHAIAAAMHTRTQTIAVRIGAFPAARRVAAARREDVIKHPGGTFTIREEQ